MTEIREGKSENAITYEILGVEQAILEGHYEQGNLSTTEKVVELISNLLYHK